MLQMLSPDVTFMNSEQLSHEIKPVNISAWMEKKLRRL